MLKGAAKTLTENTAQIHPTILIRKSFSLAKTYVNPTIAPNATKLNPINSFVANIYKIDIKILKYFKKDIFRSEFIISKYYKISR